MMSPVVRRLSISMMAAVYQLQAIGLSVRLYEHHWPTVRVITILWRVSHKKGAPVSPRVSTLPLTMTWSLLNLDFTDELTGLYPFNSSAAIHAAMERCLSDTGAPTMVAHNGMMMIRYLLTARSRRLYIVPEFTPNCFEQPSAISLKPTAMAPATGMSLLEIRHED
jgi:hypothetical protein